MGLLGNIRKRSAIVRFADYAGRLGDMASLFLPKILKIINPKKDPMLNKASI